MKQTNEEFYDEFELIDLDSWFKDRVNNFDLNDIPDEELKIAYNQLFQPIRESKEFFTIAYDWYIVENGNQKFTEEIETVCSQLKQTYNLFDWQLNQGDFNDNGVYLIDTMFASEVRSQSKLIEVIIPNMNDARDEIIRFMDSRGYQLIRKNSDYYPKLNQLWVHFLFAPMNQNVVNSELRKFNKLYHMTPLRNYDSIVKNGFVPQSREMKPDLAYSVVYSNRVYFFTDEVDENFIKLYKRTLVKERTDEQYVVFVLDSIDMYDLYDFYQDPLFDKTAVYVKETVPYKFVNSQYTI